MCIRDRATAVGAYDIINKARIFKNTKEAISEFKIVFSLSARKRDINKKHISINQFLKIINKKNNFSYGLLFGPEASGLSNDDLSFSNYILQIPTSKNFKSINLSHSLTVICYEIFKSFNTRKFSKQQKNVTIASKKEVSALIDHLKKLLDKKKFFLPEEKRHSMLSLIHI